MSAMEGLVMAMASHKLVTILIVFFLSVWISVQECKCFMVRKDPNHRAEFLDSQETYYLEWKVDRSRQQISFNVTAATTGYLFFGLANNVSAGGSDVVICGVLPNGTSYLFDMHTLGEEDGDDFPIKDHHPKARQDDYLVQGAWENETHTSISFSRALDTCDPLDYPISDNKVTIIWGYGLVDDYEDGWDQGGMQGASHFYLLDPEYSPRIQRGNSVTNGAPTLPSAASFRDDLQVWSVRRQIIISDKPTSYICSIHRAPPLAKKHHVVGFDVYFPSKGSRRRVYHLVVFKCAAASAGEAAGSSPRKIFSPFEGGHGQEDCFMPRRKQEGGMPTHLCNELWVEWAVGGRSFFTPPHVGIPFGTLEEEYYMIQTHYENVDNKRGVVVDMRVDFFYTPYLRPNDGGLLGLGGPSPQLPLGMLMPPGTGTQRFFHHCPGECTRRIFPPGGVNVYAALLHSHKSGKRLRLRHFRGRNEIGWLLHDDNYSDKFQQIRHLRREVRILPGDQLTTECTYDSSWTNGSIVAGYSNRGQEECLSFLYYYDRVSDYSWCTSQIVPSEKYLKSFLGVGNVTWSNDKLEWVATTPSNLQESAVSEISDKHVDWGDGVAGGRRLKLKIFQENYPHVSRCSKNVIYGGDTEEQLGGKTWTNTRNDYSELSVYPFLSEPYVPPQTCSYERRKEATGH